LEPNSTNASARSSARDRASPAPTIHSPEHEQKRPRTARPLPGGATPGPATPTGWLLRGAYYPTHPAPLDITPKLQSRTPGTLPHRTALALHTSPDIPHTAPRTRRNAGPCTLLDTP